LPALLGIFSSLIDIDYFTLDYRWGGAPLKEHVAHKQPNPEQCYRSGALHMPNIIAATNTAVARKISGV